jgi:hypothetical protein
MVGANDTYEKDKKSTQNFAWKCLRQWDSLKILDLIYLINDDAIKTYRGVDVGSYRS